MKTRYQYPMGLSSRIVVSVVAEDMNSDERLSALTGADDV